METIKCDICKKIRRERYSYLNEKSKWITFRIDGRGDWNKYDLCGNCSKNLLKYIKKYLKIKKPKK